MAGRTPCGRMEVGQAHSFAAATAAGRCRARPSARSSLLWLRKLRRSASSRCICMRLPCQTPCLTQRPKHDRQPLLLELLLLLLCVGSSSAHSCHHRCHHSAPGRQSRCWLCLSWPLADQSCGRRLTAACCSESCSSRAAAPPDCQPGPTQSPRRAAYSRPHLFSCQQLTAPGAAAGAVLLLLLLLPADRTCKCWRPDVCCQCWRCTQAAAGTRNDDRCDQARLGCAGAVPAGSWGCRLCATCITIPCSAGRQTFQWQHPAVPTHLHLGCISS